MAKIDFDPNGVEPLGRAGFGDYTMLAARIRAGSASQMERDFAADVLEGKRKRPANRSQSYDNFERNFKIYKYVDEQMADGGGKDAAVFAAQKKFVGVSKTTIYEAYEQISRVIDDARADIPD